MIMIVIINNRLIICQNKWDILYVDITYYYIIG